MNDTHKKILSIAAMVAALLFIGAVTVIVGKPMVQFVSDPDQFRVWVDANGLWSRVVFVAMVVFQVLIALIPGEPLEIGGGYAFGAVEGTFLCVLGITLGGLLIFLLVRKFGMKLVEVFFSTEKIRSLKFLQNEKRLTVLAFMIFAIPGTPKDLLSYFVGLTPMKLSTWLIITSVARLPSIVTSTWGGSALNEQEYVKAIIIFAITVAASGLGFFVYQRYCRWRNKRNNREKENE